MNYTTLNETENINVMFSTYNTKKYLKILDLCDYYIFITDTNQTYSPTMNLYLDYAISLYNSCDISASIIDTEITVNIEELQLITDIFGYRIQPDDPSFYNKPTTITTQAIINDINELLKYNSIYKNIKSKWSYNKIHDNKDSTNSTRGTSESKRNQDIKIGFDSTYSLECYNEQAYNSTNIYDNTLSATKNIYILFNNIFNVSFVSHQDKFFIDNFCKIFKDFEVVLDIKIQNDVTRNLCENYFQKHVYLNKEELEEKAKAFTTLYGIEKNEKSEQKEVNMILDKYFIISNDTKNRIRAMDLYQTVSDYLIPSKSMDLSPEMNVSNPLCKRLSSYFLEKGLTRKRYSDGIYYYGITPNPNALNKQPSMFSFIRRFKEPIDRLDEKLKKQDSLKPVDIFQQMTLKHDDRIIPENTSQGLNKFQLHELREPIQPETIGVGTWNQSSVIADTSNPLDISSILLPDDLVKIQDEIFKRKEEILKKNNMSPLEEIKSS
jgi:hypothetical protein